jgi:cell division septal protein FtsQ
VSTSAPLLPNQPEPRRSRRRWLAPLGIAAVVFFVFLSPVWAPLFLRRMAFFRVRHVEIIGARYVQTRDILDRLRVDTLANVWDPAGPLEERVAQHPLVREVHVGRKLPGTIVVRLVEHVPVALVSTPGGFRAYDERGVALPIDPTVADVDAPILPGADTALLRLLGTMRGAMPEMYRRLSEARRDGSSDLLLVMDSISVRASANVTLDRLGDADAVERDLERRRLRVSELDLRFRDQVVARLQ